MKHIEDRQLPTPETWTHQYSVGGKWRVQPPDVAERRIEAMTLLGDINGQRVLDLGGGPLLHPYLSNAGADVTLVDFSTIACELARENDKRVNALCMDVRQYLRLKLRYDTVIAMGLVEYLPPDFLGELFSVDADQLLIYTPIAEGYLQYVTRVTVYSRVDLENVRIKHGWRVVRQLDCREHAFVLYGRNNG